MAHDEYELWKDPLSSRYATAPMLRIFSQRNRIKTWRKVWIALAEAQRELGLESLISEEALRELRENVENIDFEKAHEKERECRHDVMAHVHAFGLVCPKAAGIIHLGATSEYVCGNADLMIQREALELAGSRLATVMAQIANEAEEYAGLPCLGYTHFQVAQPTTVGKRLCLYLWDLLMDLDRLEDLKGRFAARGAKGTVGTQASFLSLFKGNGEKVKELDRLVARKLGFETSFPVTGQTYPRKFDIQVCEVLAGIAGSAHKLSVDLRLLSHLKEMEEPFESRQTGSSAMVYKRNPMRSERLTALSRKLLCLPAALRHTQANQWLERTLDDSALRRMEIPQAFLLADSILNLLQNITAGIVVRKEQLERNLKRYLPFLSTEELLVLCVNRGKSRQDAHERLKAHAKRAWQSLLKEEDDDLFVRLVSEDSGLPVEREDVEELLKEPGRLCGRASEQTREFVSTVRKRLAPYKHVIGKLGDSVSV